MSFYLAPWDDAIEPNSGNVRQWLDNLHSKFQPVEQSRWNQSNIDTLFQAGSQTYINQHFNFSPGTNAQQFFFNFIQQPTNLVTGYQRQHRKNIIYLPSEGADPRTTDQYTRIIDHQVNVMGIAEQYSRACELACTSGLVLMQPYLDYAGDDPAQGDLKLKVWEYNSFLVDPFCRDPSFSDAQFVWCQEYISKREAEDRFPDKTDIIRPMSGTPQRYGSFYFLPENHTMNRNDLYVLSYVWYKWKAKKKKLYSPQRHQFFDFGGGDENLEAILYNIPDLQVVEVEVPCWKLAVVLNDQLMFQGLNPLGFTQFPFVPVFWNYSPECNQPDLRVRSLTRCLRDTQFLLNRRIILNHDISESSINTGWKRKVGAVANEDNLKRAGQGFDVLINDGYELQDVEKIIPNAVPPSDLALADQLINMIFQVSGVNLENWSAQEDPNASSLTVMLKQAANLTVLQKYFDQWDYSFKLLGELLLQIVLNNWNAAKVGLILGEEPSPHFYSRIFARYQTIVEEGINTPTQKSMQARQMLDINQMFGREVFPPSMIVPCLNLSGRAEAEEFLRGQEQQIAAVQGEAQNISHAFEEAKLREMISKSAMQIATARERHGRAEADIGLFEERLSEITHNRAMATKAKMEALEKMVDVIHKYGEVETMLKMNQIESFDHQQIAEENDEKVDAKRTAMSNDFVAQVMGQAQHRQAKQGARRV